jgi:hypothetical protein
MTKVSIKASSARKIKAVDTYRIRMDTGPHSVGVQLI